MKFNRGFFKFVIDDAINTYNKTGVVNVIVAILALIFIRHWL